MSGVEKAYAIANNAIYFCDSSDYKTALYEVCHALKPDIDEEEHGKCYIEEQAQLDREREPELYTLEEWHEDCGDVLWWKFPIAEAPYCGSPLDEEWPGYHTHWTRIPLPQPPREGWI